MKRRWRLWLGLTLVLFLGSSLLHPAVHWRLIGWARGEAFYQGRPTSWWARECRQWELRLVPSSDGGTLSIIEPDWVRHPTWLEQKLGLGGHTAEEIPLLLGEPTAVPVLIQLAGYDDGKVLRFALFGLGKVEKEAFPSPISPELLSALRRAANREDRLEKMAAKYLLYRLSNPD